ncbi:MAG: hypothetical protein K8T20_02810, partial [Planctomycetes bacterium]|nr:hypothetical protein [Planctomycetota bacterium]
MNSSPADPTLATPSPLFRCEFCESPVRDSMTFCPRCHLRLDEGQRELMRANVLLGETGSWRRNREVPPFIVDRLLEKYRGQHNRAMASLISHSPGFKPEIVPVAEAAIVAAPVKRVVPPAPVMTPVVPAAVVVPAPVVVPALAAPSPAPAIPVAAGAPAISSSNPDAIPASAPVEVVSLDPQGKPRFSAPRLATRKPEVPKEDLLFGILSETHLNWLASAGIFAVFVAVVLLVRNQWESFRPQLRVGLIGLAASVAIALGEILRSKTVLKMTGTSLFVLGALSAPLVFAAAAWYHATPFPSSAIGLAGAAGSAALYGWLAGRSGFGYFRWLSMSAVVMGHGFLLDLFGITGGDLAPGYGLLGAALAGLAVWKRRVEFEVSAAVVLVGSLLVSVPFVINGELHPAIGMAGALAMSAGFAILSAHDSRWMHGAWVAAGGAALAGCNATHAVWAAWPASVAAVGAAAMFVTLKKHARTEPLFIGGGVLLSVACVIAVTGYGHAHFPQADWGLLLFAAFAAPAIAVVALKRDNAFLAQATLLLPGVAFFAIKNIFHLPTGWLPIGLGGYAAALYAYGRRTDVFARVSTQVAALAHIAALALCCNPAIDDLSRLPFYWRDFAGRAAVALALPGLSLLVFRVRRDPRFLYGAEPSLLGALVFAAHGAGLAGEWMSALVAGAALLAVAAAWRFGDAFRVPTRNMGAVAAIPAVIAGFLFWSRPEGAVSLALAGAVFTAGGLAVAVDFALFVGAGLLGAAWASTTGQVFHQPLNHALGALAFLPAAAASLALRHDKRRLEALAGAGVVSVVMLCVLLASPATRVAPGAMIAAMSLGLLALATGALGFRGEETPGIVAGEPAGWSAVGALLAMVAGGYVVLALNVSTTWMTAACALVPAALVFAGSLRKDHPQGASWAI